MLYKVLNIKKKTQNKKQKMGWINLMSQWSEKNKYCKNMQIKLTSNKKKNKKKYIYIQMEYM